MDQIVFVDANIFLEIALEDQNSDKCKRFVQDIIDGKIKAVTSDFIVFSCLIQIQNKTKDTQKMRDFILFLNSINNLAVLHFSLSDIIKSIENTKKYKLDFDDSLVLAYMINNNLKTLVSFDRDFDKINIITREEPNKQ